MSYTDRKELKYLIDYKTFVRVRKFIEPFTVPDKRAGPGGTYLVNSLYFDTIGSKSFWEKIDGEKIRKKVRIRSYLDSKTAKAENTILEMKKKNDRTVYKEKIEMSFADALSLIETGDAGLLGKRKLSKAEQQALDGFIFLKYKYGLLPKIVIGYERMPLVDKFNPKVRLTFDFNVKYRTEDFSTENAEMENYAIPPYLIIVEIKHTGPLPVWVTKMVQIFDMRLATVSKYCEALSRSFIEKSF